MKSFEGQIGIIERYPYDVKYDEVLITEPQTLISREEYESFNLDTYGQS